MNNNNMNNNTNMSNNDNTTNTKRIKINKIKTIDLVDYSDLKLENNPKYQYMQCPGPSLEEVVMSGRRIVDEKMRDLKLIDAIFDVLWRVGEYKDPVKKVKRVLVESRAESWEKINELVDSATAVIQKRIEKKIGEYSQIEVMEFDKQYGCSVPTYYPDDEKMPEWREKERKEWRKLYQEWAILTALYLQNHLISRHV